MDDARTVTRRLGLPAPVTVTDEYLAVLLVEMMALRAAVERLAASDPAPKPTAKRRTTKDG